jgi:hypothetical protein
MPNELGPTVINQLPEFATIRKAEWLLPNG